MQPCFTGPLYSSTPEDMHAKWAITSATGSMWWPWEMSRRGSESWQSRLITRRHIHISTHADFNWKALTGLRVSLISFSQSATKDVFHHHSMTQPRPASFYISYQLKSCSNLDKVLQTPMTAECLTRRRQGSNNRLLCEQNRRQIQVPGCFRRNTSLWDDTKWNLKMKYKALLSSAVWPPDENDHKKLLFHITRLACYFLNSQACHQSRHQNPNHNWHQTCTATNLYLCLARCLGMSAKKHIISRKWII